MERCVKRRKKIRVVDKPLRPKKKLKLIRKRPTAVVDSVIYARSDGSKVTVKALALF